MTILDKRITYKPTEYPHAEQFWEMQQRSHWLWDECKMSQDIYDWETKLTEVEKTVISKILKGFTQVELIVEDYWSKKVAKWFPKREIVDMAITFGAFETIHAKAYNMLAEALGIDDFSEFLQDPIIMEKFNKLYETNNNNTDDLEHKAFSLAIFSAFTEGVCLYSSFAVLQSFKLKGLLGGISKIVEFSIRDENVHSVAGCWLFNTLVNEYPELKQSKTLENKIYQAAEFIIQIETKFMDHVLEDSIDNVNKQDIENFIIERVNQKLIEIGYEPKFKYNKESADGIGEWFYRLNKGIVQQDFFAALESNYAKGVVTFEDDEINWDF